MVARLTIGREKFREHEELMKSALEGAYRLRIELADLIDMDTDSYDNVTSAYKLPKGTEEEKAMRGTAIQDALKMATNIPAETMEKAEQALSIAEGMKGKVNPNCASDLEVAILSLRAASMGAWQNVLTNLCGIKDELFVERTRNRCIECSKALR